VFTFWADPGQFVGAAQKLLTGVPEYPYYCGCAPTCGVMVFGFWDSHGYPNLLPGRPWPINNAIKNLIASSGHIRDYWVGLNSTSQDPYVAGGWTRHADNCIADFMATSRYPNADGWTNRALLANGLVSFAKWDDPTTPVREGYSFSATLVLGLTFEQFVREIDAGRPVLLFVRLRPPDGPIDHTVVGFGYDDSSPAAPKFAAMDTYMGNAPGVPDWWSWPSVAGGVTCQPVSPPQHFPTGDVDQDGQVNISDLLLVRNCLGLTALRDPIAASADANNDGIVNIADLLIVRNHLGAASSP